MMWSISKFYLGKVIFLKKLGKERKNFLGFEIFSFKLYIKRSFQGYFVTGANDVPKISQKAAR